MIAGIFLGLKLLQRQWKGGLLKLLALSFVLCIALMTGMNSLGTRLSLAMDGEASTLMGADLIMTSSRPIQSDFIDKAKSLNLEHTVLVEFITMSLFHDDPILAFVKSVEIPYPLMGAIKLSEVNHEMIPQSGEVWLHADWKDRFGVSLQDTLHIGREEFKVTNFILQEPEVGANVFTIAPRVLMNSLDLDKTGVIQPGSRVEYRLQLKGEDKNLKEFTSWVKPKIGSNEQIINLKDDRPELANTIDRAERYLILVAFSSIVLAGTTILLSLREYAQEQRRTVSLLRTFGVTKNTLLIIYFGSILIFGIILGILGTVLGFGLQAGIAYLLETKLGMHLPGVPVINGLMGIVTGLILMAGFSLPYLSALVKQSPLSIFHDEVHSPIANKLLVATSLCFALLIMLVLYTQDLVFSFSTIFLFIVLFIVSSAFLSMLIRLIQCLKPLVRSPYKLGLSRLALHKSDSIIQVLGLSLSLTLILLLTFVRHDLINQWQATFPENPPNHYVFNILPSDLEPLREVLDTQGIPHTDFFPIVKARLVIINGNPIDLTEFPPGAVPNYLKRELNNTALDLPRDIDVLVKGEWWPEHTSANLVSVEESVAETLGLKIGDSLGFSIADKLFYAQIANIRQVKWENFEPNFYMIFSEATLKDYPRTYLSSMHVSNDKSIMTLIAKQFPSVTVISVSDVLTEMKRIIGDSSQYMTGLLMIILGSSILLLFTTSRIQLQTRIKESEILLRLGAKRRELLWGLLCEYFVSAILCSSISFAIATTLIYFLGRGVFQSGIAHLPLMYFPLCVLFVFIIQACTAGRFIRVC